MDKKFLEKQKQKLIETREVVEKQLKVIAAADPFADTDRVNDNAASDTDAREEMGHLAIEAEKTELMNRLKLIMGALDRIDKGTYGFCLKTGKIIPKKRLELVPEAMYCIE